VKSWADRIRRNCDRRYGYRACGLWSTPGPRSRTRPGPSSQVPRPIPGPGHRSFLDILTSFGQDIMMPFMRTTLTLEPEVAARLKSEVRRTGRPFKVVVNEALKRGLGLLGRPGRRERFEVRPHAFGFKPGIDLDRLNQLADELEVEEAARKLRR
jgi:hypothetical protein